MDLLSFITKKYKDKIKKLEDQIKFMKWEWEQERQLYGKKTKERFLKQKVDWILGGVDLKTHREIHRPIYGLTKTETKEICEVTKYHLNKTGFKAQVLFHWSEDKSCYVIDVKINAY